MTKIPVVSALYHENQIGNFDVVEGKFIPNEKFKSFVKFVRQHYENNKAKGVITISKDTMEGVYYTFFKVGEHSRENNREIVEINHD